jgi:hypothetical protein
MSGSTTTAPIRADVATGGDYRSRALLDDRRQAPGHHGRDAPATDSELLGAPVDAEQSLAAPTPLEAPGSAFAAAIVAGALPVQPATSSEVLLRTSRAWAPPDSDLHLTDRIA